jgi:co-chaperonin GroES (HSP10)
MNEWIQVPAVVHTTAAEWQNIQIPVETPDPGLVPLGRAILVEPFEPERQGYKASGIIIPEGIEKNERSLDMRVKCVAIGPQAWKAIAQGGLDEPNRCQPGDVILVARMSGTLVTGPKDGKQYRLVSDRDVIARLTWFGDSNG